MTHETKVEEQGDNQIVITRSFAASPQLVFDALTKPELMKRWLKGPDGWSMNICEVDLQEGGVYRYGWVGPEGLQMQIEGEYRTIKRPSHLENTEHMSGAPAGQAALSSAVLEAHGSDTLMTTTITYPSREARTQAVESNMAAGVAASHKWLDAALQELETEDGQ